MSKRMGRVCSLLAASSLLTLAGVAHATPMGISAGSGSPLKGAAASALNDKRAVVTTATPSRAVTFEVFLPIRNEAGLDALIARQQDPKSASYHKWLTPAQFGAQFGPTASSMSNVQSALSGAGLQVSAVHTRSVTVTSTVAQVNKAFGIGLKTVTSPSGASRLVAPTALAMPSALMAEGVVIASFNGLPPKQSDARLATGKLSPANRTTDHGGYWFTDLKQAYNYPAYNTPLASGQAPDGTGVSTAIVINSGAQQADAALMFNHEKFSTITGKQNPTFSVVPINGGGPSNTVDDLFEASLDSQQILGGAPGAGVTLIDIPDLSDESIISGYLYIVESNAYDIVNSSFGGCELTYTAAYNNGTDFTGILKTYDTLFAQGNAQGITFVASSGDQGGLLCPEAGYVTGAPPANGSTYMFVPGVSFPADSPHVTAVGGGNLVTTTPPSPQTVPATLTSKYVAENANGDPEVPYDPYGFGVNVSGGYWGAGGGRSQIFTALGYQAVVDTGSPNGKRTLPDIGMQVGGCPGGLAVTPCGPERSYVLTYVQGGLYGVIGTSVSSPEFVGAAAIYIQSTGSRQGNLNYYLYAQGAQQQQGGTVTSYHLANGITGFDGKWYNTGPSMGGYDYLYGNGSPRVKDLFGFSSLGKIGDPQTPSNP